MASREDSSRRIALPRDRYESYLNLKHDTNLVLDWLRTNACDKGTPPAFNTTLTSNDILHAAKVVAAKKVPVSSHIQRAFQ